MQLCKYRFFKKKKIFLLLVLMVMAIIVGLSSEQFYHEKEYNYTSSKNVLKDDTEERNPVEIALDGSQEFRQEFIAPQENLLKVLIDFKAWEHKNATGKIVVEIQDENGTVLSAAKKKPGKLTQAKSSTMTSFSVETKLTKGKTYTLVLRSDNVKSPKGIYVYNNYGQDDLLSTLTVNGESTDGHLEVRFKTLGFDYKEMLSLLLLIAAGMVFVLIPFDKMRFKVNGKYIHEIDMNKIVSRIFFIFSVPAAFFIVQCYSGYHVTSFIKLLTSLRGITNCLLYGLIWWLIYLICNRTKYTAVLLVLVSSFLGLVNYFVWEFRGIPIMAADVASLGTAMSVAENYTYQLNDSALWALGHTVVFICAVLSLDNYKGIHWKKRILVLAGFFLPYSVFYTQLLHGDLMKDHKITVSVWEPSRNYAKNGSLLSFFLSYTYYVVDKPSNYSRERVEEIAEKYISDPASDKEKPNIIVVMNEAFSDLNVNGELETSEDYMPFIHGLTENTIKGNLYVSVFGGNTANTEFEFLTGCSMAFLPFRSIPYDTYVKDFFPSLTYSLKEDGYTGNIAVHPASKAAWSRDTAYPFMGFDVFYGIGDFENPQYIRSFPSDATDFDFIISKYEENRKTSKDPFYAFTVTIQNHSGYGKDQGLVDTSIEITNDAQKNEEAQQYINLIKASDDAFKNMIEYFEKVKEPTIILMFGDHQPSLKSTFYESLFGMSKESWTLNEISKKHTVPYIIWANYDIEEKQADMSANYLSAYLMQSIGGDLTGYQKYLLDLYQQVPMITANAYCGNDGVLHELDEKSEYSELIADYKMIQYNNMFDSENRLDSFYHLK